MRAYANNLMSEVYPIAWRIVHHQGREFPAQMNIYCASLRLDLLWRLRC